MSLTQNRYGKSQVGVLRTWKDQSGQFQVQDYHVEVLFEGDKLDLAYTHDNNKFVVPTDTIKNTIYLIAKQNPGTSAEAYGINLTRHFLSEYAHISTAIINITENLWSRMNIKNSPHPHSFISRGPLLHTVRIIGKRRLSSGGANKSQDPFILKVISGVKDLYILKTTGSGFEDFWTDKYTTLQPARDRLLKTKIKARWTFEEGRTDVDYGKIWQGVIDVIYDIFAGGYSASVQATLYKMGKAVLERFEEIGEIWLSGPNIHNWEIVLVGGVKNGEVYNPVPEPVGFITATITREKHSKL